MINQKSKHTFSIIAGHLFEHYDITLYGFFAVVLAPVFFPSSSFYTAQIATFGAFAAGFLMRPLGGVIFGYIGDHYGRRQALLLSISFAVFPTLSIGLLPTYEYIGLASPILLILFRLIQGISVGGEYSGALIYIFEHAQEKRPAFKAGLLIGSGFGGAVLGTAVGTLCTLSFMPSWGWRIPFILGGIMGFIIYLLRRNVQETPEFQALSDLNQPKSYPLKYILSLHKKQFLSCIIFGGANLVPLYLATVFINSWLVELGLTRTEILLNNTILLLYSGFLMPIVGKIADHFGIFRVMKTALITSIIFTLPLYIYSTSYPSYEKYIMLQTYLAIINACIITPLASFLPTLFPSTYRYTGLSVSYTLGQATLGGLTPLLATLLMSLIGYKWAPSLLLIASAFLFLVCLKICLRDSESSFKETDN